MSNSTSTPDMQSAKRRLLLRGILFFTIIPVILFLPAGTLRYWQGWLYYMCLFIPSFLILVYLWKYDPSLLSRRARKQETEKAQQWIIKFLKLVFWAGFLIPGLDYRYQWSSVPAAIVVGANIGFFLGYLLIFFVFKENTFASRTIQVEQNQKVITTGPYALVRHPMYLGASLFYLSTPLALGSFWALILFSILPLLLVFRLLKEEQMLMRELSGYSDYCQQTRYRLLPFIW